MKPGTIIHSEKFKFKDGTSKGKFAIVLCDEPGGSCILVSTTSQPEEKTTDYGCQSDSKRPNFCIPRGYCEYFPKDTWVALNDFYEFESIEIHSRGASGLVSGIGSGCCRKERANAKRVDKASLESRGAS